MSGREKAVEVTAAENPAERDLPIKYHISYPWGSLSVTEEADSELGLVPLTAEVVKGKAEAPAENPDRPYIAVTLVGPSETPPYMWEEVPGTTAGVWATKSVYTGRINIAVGSTKSTEEIRQTVLAGIMETTGMDEEELAENIVEEHGIPLPEAVSQETSQFIVYALHAFMAEPVAQCLVEWSDRKADEKFIKSMTKIGGVTLLTTAYLVGLEVAYHESDFVTATTAAGLLTVSGLTAFALRDRFKRYLENKRDLSLVNEHVAHAMGVSVANDIHETFCTEHFDRQEQGWMGEETEEDEDS
ncbi:hypothetical protein HYS84_01045 [Candidatus Saccharibacteria bacterium]|nr:hypothetical protein [Candidatus Saccharibacteria bacterium]